ncbi:helix-turn-helix domain-containing protein [Streptomyces sp. ISL-36]|uniref:PucR family transcriptional regulator n=1 Tax=Streptomyces sp. ISL-36 TaxID=2819182 RepID=UPI001BE88BBF|nr:helix-turn-helix domain-containing protein [Streptomyces sp. ISL-36]MBT2445140.1 helix-turn-helix domain-containing protein [Streptomyces sp. ISL-36]
MTHQWLLQLEPDPDRSVDPAMPPAAVADAVDQLGMGPVQWAVQTADTAARDILRQVPEHGGGQGPVATLRRSTESAVLAALRLLVSDPPGDISALTDETLDGCREFARRGIPLDQVLRGVRLGHGRLAHDLAAAIDRHVPSDQRLAELRRVNDLLFVYADSHASMMAEEYIAERDRWRGSDEAARRAIVDDVLAGRPVDPQAATRRLHYDISRTHLAAVLWCDDTGGSLSTAERLHRTAVAMTRTMSATGMLLIAADNTSAWAWFTLTDEDASGRTEHLRDSLDRQRNVRAALGPPASGPQGMRRSHLGALQAQRIAHHSGQRLCDYREVRLVALATADPEHAHWFVQDVLGPLASGGDRVRELRETLRVYLAEERSLRTAADRLHVARNTITYRVKRAEELLPAPTTAGNSLELRVALEIAQQLPCRRPAREVTER